jgi:hypothetical protein
VQSWQYLFIKRFLMRCCLSIILFFAFSILSFGREPILVADHTFKVEGVHEYFYAFAEGDQLDLEVGLVVGNRLKKVELIAWPDRVVYSGYDVDTIITKRLAIPHTGVYLWRVTEQGIGKKVCRFTIYRTAAGPATVKMDTRVGWDIRTRGQWIVERRRVETGKKTESYSVSGQVSVPGSKIGLGVNRMSYRFELPANTIQWAYRIGVSQVASEARRKDAEMLAELSKKGAMKIAAFQPQTALASYAMGVAMQLTTSTSGEDIEYALVDLPNLQRFMQGEDQYDAFIWQGSVSVDAQRRQQPLAGTYAFALKNNNVLEGVEVMVEIEAILETPILEDELYLVPQ